MFNKRCNHKFVNLSNHVFHALNSQINGYVNKDVMIESMKRGVISVIQCEKCGIIEHIKTVL